MLSTRYSLVRRNGVVAMSVAALLFSFVPLIAASDFAVITTEEVKTLMARKENMVFIDVRTPEEYMETHVAGAVNIPEKGFEEAAARLPGDKKTLLLIYCKGVKCCKSKKVAEKVEPLGYTAIFIYREGISVWEERNLPW